MKAQRIYPNEHGGFAVAPGTYWREKDGVWWMCTPTGFAGKLTGHTVEEHEDGTITVNPSILTPVPEDSSLYYHGWLKHGEWTS